MWRRRNFLCDEQLIKTESYSEIDRQNYEQRLNNNFQ